MASVVCKKCGKTVSDNINACYHCGELLQAPKVCTECKRENVAGRSACQYCGAALTEPVSGPPAAPAAVKRTKTRMGFEEPAAPPIPSKPAASPAPVAPAKKGFEVIGAPVSNATSAFLSSDEIVDLVLLLLAAPAAVWGLIVLIPLDIFMMMRGGGGFTLFKRIANPNPYAFIFPALLGLVISYFISNNTTPASGFLYTNLFLITCVSSGIGVLLLVRRLLRGRRRRSTANDLFRP